jgi:hypothetical protein
VNLRAYVSHKKLIGGKSLDHHSIYNHNSDHHKQYEPYYRDTDVYNHDVVSVGKWVLLLIVLAIPIINLVVLLVLAFGNDNINLKNFAKASLIIMVIGLVFALLVGGYS